MPFVVRCYFLLSNWDLFITSCPWPLMIPMSQGTGVSIHTSLFIITQQTQTIHNHKGKMCEIFSIYPQPTRWWLRGYLERDWMELTEVRNCGPPVSGPRGSDCNSSYTTYDLHVSLQHVHILPLKLIIA